MAVKIVHAPHDENRQYSGGKAGDQTGEEVCIQNWYSRPWDYIARPTYVYIAQRIALIAKTLAESPKIGYDQDQRTTLYRACEKIQWQITKIKDLPECECDCSSFISVVLRFVGIEIPETVWTGNLDYYLAKTGYFTLLYQDEIRGSDRYIREGDILVNRLHHAAIAVSSGSGATIDVDYLGRVNVRDYLQVRETPEAKGRTNEFHVLDYDGKYISYHLPPNMVVRICEQSGNWGRLADIAGWVCLDYIVPL